MQRHCRTTCSMARAFALLAVMVGLVLPYRLFAQTDPRGARSPFPKEQDLLQAQIDYYRAQTQKLNSKPSQTPNTNQSVASFVRANLGSIVTVIAAVLAGGVALTQLHY